MELNQFIQAGLPTSLALIMLSLGLTTRLDLFIRQVSSPRATMTGLLAQLCLVPLLAFCVAVLLDMPPALATGLMILSFCPGGVTSNWFSHMSRANVPLSISLTVIASLITPFTIPLLSELALRWQMDENRVVEIHGIARDITEKKRSDEALRKSEEQYRLLVENAQEAITVTQNGMIKYANPRAMEIAGYDMNELLSLPYMELVYPEDREKLMSQDAHRPPDSIHNYNFRMVSKDGQIRWIELNAITIDWEGEAASLDLFNDITERREAQTRLAESEARYREMVENINEVLFNISVDGSLTYISPAIERIVGVKKKEFVGNGYHRFIHPEDLPHGCHWQCEGLVSEAERNPFLQLLLLRFFASCAPVRQCRSKDVDPIRAAQTLGLKSSWASSIA